MPAGRNIQVFGVEAVMQCYENNKIPCWAVVCDKNVNAKFNGESCEEGAEVLKQYLEMLKKYDSSATYSLRLYEDMDKPIRSNTPYDIGFNFSLREKDELNPAMNLPAVQGLNSNTLTSLLREISKLETENAVLKMEAEQDADYIEELEKLIKEKPVEDQKTIAGTFLEQFTPTLVEWGKAFGQNLFNAQRQTALAGVPVSEQDEKQIIEAAVSRLKATMKRYTVGQVLTQIAEISEKEPDKFDFYLSMLMK